MSNMVLNLKYSRRQLHQKLGAGVLSALLFGGLGALSSQAQAQPVQGGSINVATIGEPPTLDPMVSTADLVSIVTQHMFETLYTFGEGWKVVPLLAQDLPKYSDEGKTLTITPTINPDGYVNLAVKQTNNSVTNNVQFNAPIINKQEATTQVFIRDGQTTVFGGLSDNSRDRSTSGIPFLSRIPLIGGLLFGNSKRNETVSELYLFLTPHIVSSDEDVDRLREAVKGQSTLLDGMNVGAKIIPKGDTIRIGDPVRPKSPDAKPRTDTVRVRPDSLTKRPEAR